MSLILVKSLILFNLWVVSIRLVVTTNQFHDASGTVDLIKSRGFIAEPYVIQNEGYSLFLYRVINPLADQNTLNRHPVLYGHGVLFDTTSMISRSGKAKPRKPVLGKLTIKYGNLVDSSDDYSLPFMLSNNNFDVWLFDSRGSNLNGQVATKQNLIELQKFWDFSLDDQALIDIPLLIDFVLMKTGSTKLVYVGYSQTTLLFFALLATAPEYSEKIVASVCLAPVAHTAHIKGLSLPVFASLGMIIPNFIQQTYLPQPLVDSFDSTLNAICSSKISLIGIVCGTLVSGFGGSGLSEESPDFYSNFFKSTSIKAVKQYVQLATGKRFGMYDYGYTENMKRYGQAHPPAYDLGRITSDRIILVRGSHDFLSDPDDNEILVKGLGKKPYLDIVIPQYNHFDFINGKDLIRLVNAPVLTAIYELMYKEGPNILKDFAPMKTTSSPSANARKY